MVEIKKENKYNAQEMSDQYRSGYKDGYVQGLRDGKWLKSKIDNGEDVV